MEFKDKRTAILVISLGFIGLYLFFEKLRHPSLLYISFIIGTGSLISSYFENFILYIWGKIGLVLGWINTRILLSVIFFLLLFPISLLAKISKKDLLKLKKGQLQSIFVERNHTFEKKDLENIW